jgi:hypothetical protein
MPAPPPGPIDPTPLTTYQRDRSIPRTVPWFHDRNTRALNGALGGAKDDQQARDRFALMARYTDGPLMQATYRRVSRRDPTVGIPPTAGDAERLRRLGTAKGLTQYETETDEAFVARIDRTIEDIQELGTIDYIIKQLQAYGIPDVDALEECYTPLVVPAVPFARRFLIILGPDYGSLGWGPLKMPFKLGSVIMGVAGMTRAQAIDLIRILRGGKTADSVPIAIVWRFGDGPMMGMGLKMPFVLGGSKGSGVARMRIMAGMEMGDPLGGKLGIWYVTE